MKILCGHQLQIMLSPLMEEASMKQTLRNQEATAAG